MRPYPPAARKKRVLAAGGRGVREADGKHPGEGRTPRPSAATRPTSTWQPTPPRPGSALTTSPPAGSRPSPRPFRPFATASRRHWHSSTYPSSSAGGLPRATSSSTRPENFARRTRTMNTLYGHGTPCPYSSSSGQSTWRSSRSATPAATRSRWTCGHSVHPANQNAAGIARGPTSTPNERSSSTT